MGQRASHIARSRVFTPMIGWCSCGRRRNHFPQPLWRPKALAGVRQLPTGIGARRAEPYRRPMLAPFHPCSMPFCWYIPDQAAGPTLHASLLITPHEAEMHLNPDPEPWPLTPACLREGCRVLLSHHGQLGRGSGLLQHPADHRLSACKHVHDGQTNR